MLHARQSKVENLQHPVRGQENVVGFQIAMDESLIVGRRQTARDAMMFGCESAATAFASRSNRASRSGSFANVVGRTLIATKRSRRGSRA